MSVNVKLSFSTVLHNLAAHAKRITVQQKDMVLLQTLRKRLDPGWAGRN